MRSMKTLMLNRAECNQLLSLQELFPLIRSVLKTASAHLMERTDDLAFTLPTGRIPGIPAYSVNARSDQGPDTSMLQLFRASDHQLLAIMPAVHVTELSLMAFAAFGTDILASHEAKTVGIIGWNESTEKIASALLFLRPYDHLLVYPGDAQSPKIEHNRHAHPTFEAVHNVDTILSEADILLVSQSATQWLKHAIFWRPGLHITVVGEKLQALPRAFRQPVRFWSEQLHQVTGSDFQLHSCVAGIEPPKERQSHITVFHANSLPYLELAAAWQVYKKALYHGHGSWMDFVK
ncbi:hypothetical protein [Aureibacillus halotolerans]|uniref:Ornithine cyclodeaminase/alanine dehydrogenase-like protein (Mu-crystallin family) n=1 Tax=Aureibacillus halotolerans TaxID=1508390 RepID=A0A4R6UC87_9BACI|nr:hypothetical protein [Aureibacillus halotolerans]TDQ42703.1 ornithine cyclodeaminase/alanine dehydrogenase-like protein (mu-crystallin family) [Aureibacillus halotolerans]